MSGTMTPTLRGRHRDGSMLADLERVRDVLNALARTARSFHARQDALAATALLNSWVDVGGITPAMVRAAAEKLRADDSAYGDGPLDVAEHVARLMLVAALETSR